MKKVHHVIILKLKTGAKFTTKKLIRILARNGVTKTQNVLNTFTKRADDVFCHIVITTNLAMINGTVIDLEEDIARGHAIQKVRESCFLLQQNLCKIKSKIMC